MFKIEYNQQVYNNDYKKLPKNIKKELKKVIETKLQIRPEIFGKPLRQSLRGFRTLRVGDYRVIFQIKESTIKIEIIEHRAKVYQEALKRIFG